MARIREIDGLRGVAILMVLIWHFWSMNVTDVPGTWLWHFNRWFDLCWSGVDLFFVISGFLITTILLNNLASRNYFRVFFVRRVCRIWPLYLVFILAFFAIRHLAFVQHFPYTLLVREPMPVWSYLTFTQNYFMGMRAELGPYLLAVTWSLAVEEQFYLIIPFLVKFIQRNWALGGVLVVILSALALRYVWPGFPAYVYTPLRADSLFSGVALAYLTSNPGFMHWAHQRKRGLTGAGVLLALGYGALSCWGDPTAVHDFPERLKYGGWIHFYLALFYGLLILLTCLKASPFLSRILTQPSLLFLGKYAYGIYLIHPVMAIAMVGFLQKPNLKLESLSDVFWGTVTLLMTFGLAWVSYHGYEKFFLRWGERVRY